MDTIGTVHRLKARKIAGVFVRNAAPIPSFLPHTTVRLGLADQIQWSEVFHLNNGKRVLDMDFQVKRLPFQLCSPIIMVIR